MQFTFLLSISVHMIFLLDDATTLKTWSWTATAFSLKSELTRKIAPRAKNDQVHLQKLREKLFLIVLSPSKSSVN